jgi:glycosyltransferase involved in cell wall biosynthesis
MPQLPDALPGKRGWPWTDDAPALPGAMPDGRPWPRISLVTPSYNQGRFLEQTIRSVLLQGYPNLEYIVMDGGSTDDSVQVIKKYERFLTRWVSRPDRGQVDAITQGLHLASGAWFNWLNADDILLPQALATFARLARLAGDARWITGGRLLMAEDGTYVDVDMPWRTDPSVVALDAPSFPQDATFVRTDFIKRPEVRLREDVNVFDTVLYFELFRIARPVLTTALFSAMRLHPQQKTAEAARLRKENETVLEPLYRVYPPVNRVLLRLLRTRLGPVVSALLRGAVYYGLAPSARRWRAVAYRDFAWRVLPVREVLR